jgi:hypothetical protein
MVCTGGGVSGEHLGIANNDCRCQRNYGFSRLTEQHRGVDEVKGWNTENAPSDSILARFQWVMIQ